MSSPPTATPSQLPDQITEAVVRLEPWATEFAREVLVNGLRRPAPQRRLRRLRLRALAEGLARDLAPISERGLAALLSDAGRHLQAGHSKLPDRGVLARLDHADRLELTESLRAILALSESNWPKFGGMRRILKGIAGHFSPD